MVARMRAGRRLDQRLPQAMGRGRRLQPPDCNLFNSGFLCQRLASSHVRFGTEAAPDSPAAGEEALARGDSPFVSPVPPGSQLGPPLSDLQIAAASQHDLIPFSPRTLRPCTQPVSRPRAANRVPQPHSEGVGRPHGSAPCLILACPSSPGSPGSPGLPARPLSKFRSAGTSRQRLRPALPMPIAVTRGFQQPCSTDETQRYAANTIRQPNKPSEHVLQPRVSGCDLLELVRGMSPSPASAKCCPGRSRMSIVRLRGLSSLLRTRPTDWLSADPKTAAADAR